MSLPMKQNVPSEYVFHLGECDAILHHQLSPILSAHFYQRVHKVDNSALETQETLAD